MRRSVKPKEFEPDAVDKPAVEALEGLVAGYSLTPRGRIYGVHCNRKFSDSNVDSLLQVPGLLELTVSQYSDHAPRFTLSGFKHALRHPSLFAFGCANNQTLGDDCAAAISDSQSIRRLILPGCPITDVGVRHLAQSPQLQGLNLSFTQITDDCVPDLSRLVELRRLSLTGTALSAESLATLTSCLTKCRIVAP